MSNTTDYRILKDKILELISTGEFRKYAEIQSIITVDEYKPSYANIARVMQEVAVKDEAGIYRIKHDPYIQLSLNLLKTLHEGNYFYSLKKNSTQNTIIAASGKEYLIAGLLMNTYANDILAVLPGMNVIEVITISDDFSEFLLKTYNK